MECYQKQPILISTQIQCSVPVCSSNNLLPPHLSVARQDQVPVFVGTNRSGRKLSQPNLTLGCVPFACTNSSSLPLPGKKAKPSAIHTISASSAFPAISLGFAILG